MTSKYSMPLVRLLINGKNPHARLCAPLARALAILYCSPIASLNRFVFAEHVLEILEGLVVLFSLEEELPGPEQRLRSIHRPRELEGNVLIEIGRAHV